MIANSESYQEVAQSQYAAALPVGLICFGIITPIAEELLFRGIIYSCLRRYMKLFSAMLISAAFFAVYHGNSVQGIYAVVLGLLMAYAYEYFGDFKMSVAVHVLANVLAYVLSSLKLPPALLSWPACVVCLACGVAGVWLLNRQKKIF
nr:CPBP family intramembrane glutamic endopeptidase [uncultured Acetatifactor sp.]